MKSELIRLASSLLVILILSGCGRNPEPADAAKAVQVNGAITGDQSARSNSGVTVQHLGGPAAIGPGAARENIVGPCVRKNMPGCETSDTIKEIIALLKETGNVEHARKRISAVVSKNDKAVDEAVALLATETDSEVAMLIVNSLVDAGTEKAIDALLGVFSQMSDDNSLKRQVGDAIMEVTNPACADVLLDVILSANELSDVTDVAQRALGNIADDNVLNKVEQVYYSTRNDTDKQLLSDAVRYAQGTNVVEALMRLSDPSEASRSEPIAVAACDTLGIIGTSEACTYLLVRLSSVPEGTTDPAFDSLIRDHNAESLPVLLLAAKGKQAGISANARIAAITALRNFNMDKVGAVLETIVQTTGNSQVLDAAEQSLAALRQMPAR